MTVQALERIERLNYVFGALLIAISIVAADQSLSLGIAAGVALTCLNFTVIRRLVTKLLAAPPDKRGLTAFIFLPKMTGLLVAVSLVMYFLPVSPIGVGIGFSIFLLSIMVESIRFMSGTALSQ